jgi:hypothetical protein
MKPERKALSTGWLWLIILVSLLVIAIARAATPDQIQTCSALAPTAPALVGCPNANVGWGPKLTTDLVRTQVPGAQAWKPFNTLTPDSMIVLKSTGKWAKLSSITVTPAPTSPAPPVIPPPVFDPPPVNVVVSLDGGEDPLYRHGVTWTNIPAGSCFTLTDGTHTAHACL